MEPDSENYEKCTNVKGASTPKVFKNEYGNNVEIKLEMALATKGESIEETSPGVMDKKPKLRWTIVQISPGEKLSAETFDEKDKSVYFKGVK